MKCESEILTAYVLGDLDEAEAKVVEMHTAECETCARRLAELRQTVNLLAALPEAERRPADMARLKSTLASRWSLRAAWIGVKERLVRRPRWAVALATAACLAVLGFHYGVAIRVGTFELAFGGPSQGESAQVQPAVAPPRLVLDEAALRGLVQDEIRTTVTPAFLDLAQYYNDQLVALHNTYSAQRNYDILQMRDNIRFVANAVEESLGVR